MLGIVLFPSAAVIKYFLMTASSCNSPSSNCVSIFSRQRSQFTDVKIDFKYVIVIINNATCKKQPLRAATICKCQLLVEVVRYLRALRHLIIRARNHLKKRMYCYAPTGPKEMRGGLHPAKWYNKIFDVVNFVKAIRRW